MLAHRSLTTGLLGMACCIGLFWQVRGEPLPRGLLPQAPAAAREADALSAGPCLLERSVAGAARGPEPPAVNVVDVAAAAANPALIAQLIGVGEGERVTAVDEHPVASDLEAGAWLAARLQGEAMDARAPLARPQGALVGGNYLDVTIERAGGSRRVLVLLH